MNLTRVLGGAALGGVAAAVTNRLLRVDPTALEPPLGRPLSTYRWRGFDVAYTEAGDASDPDLVLLHGVNAAASSHEFRYVVDALADRYHVLAPDLPGFGHTDRPPVLYSGELYVTFLRDFISELTSEPTVVASSLSAAYAAVAADDPDASVAELLLVCPTATTTSSQRRWLRELLRSPGVGETLFNLLVSKPAIRYFLLEHGFTNASVLTEEWVDYDWKMAHVPGARFAPASFVSGFLDLEVDLAATLEGLDATTTVLWGRDAELPPLASGRELARRADVRLLVFDDADLLPHAEYPEAFVGQL